MARARNIKPGFFKNEDLAECSPWARLCFAGLWTLADRDGRLEDRPKRIKGELFAFDSIEVDPLLNELERFGFVERYKNSDGSFIQISKFAEHQTPHYSEKPSVIKPPRFQESGADEESKTPRGLQEDSKKEASLRGVRNPLNPDSLNPDSLNPDSLNPDSLNPEKGEARASRPPSNFEPPAGATMAGAVCVALKSIGMGRVAPGNQTLKNLLDAGADIGMFVEAGREAVDRGKDFGYALAIVKRQLRDNETMAVNALATVNGATNGGILAGAI